MAFFAQIDKNYRFKVHDMQCFSHKCWTKLSTPTNIKSWDFCQLTLLPWILGKFKTVSINSTFFINSTRFIIFFVIFVKSPGEGTYLTPKLAFWASK